MQAAYYLRVLHEILNVISCLLDKDHQVMVQYTLLWSTIVLSAPGIQEKISCANLHVLAKTLHHQEEGRGHKIEIQIFVKNIEELITRMCANQQV